MAFGSGCLADHSVDLQRESLMSDESRVSLAILREHRENHRLAKETTELVGAVVQLV